MKILIGIELISMLFLLLFAVAYLTKKRADTNEIKLYTVFLIIGIIGFIIEISNNTSAILYGANSLSSKIIAKIYMIHYLIFNILLIQYTFMKFIDSSTKSIEEKNKYNKIVTLVLIIFSCLSSVFLVTKKATIHYTGDYYYGTGPTTKYIAFISILTATIIILWGIIRYKILSKKEKTLIISIIVFYSINGIVRALFPYFTINNTIFSFIIAIMFFTIENPDIEVIKELELANSIKDSFLSSMSHQIKTPLNIIMGLSENIQLSENELKENISDINKESKILSEILNNLIDMNVIREANPTINNVNYNLKDSFDKIIYDYKKRIEDNNVAFKYNFSEEIPKTLNGDIEKISMCVIRLLSNSWKYTRVGEIILNFDWNKEESSLIIEVKDTGDGIEDINNLFKDFSRNKEELNSVTPGVGLGLTLCKKLVDAMNGELLIESQKDLGTNAKITIPQQVVNSNEVIEQKEVPEQKLSSNKNHILIVDDNKLNLKVAKKLAESLGYTVDECESGPQSINKIKTGNTYDCIFMDIMMPEMDGVEAMRIIKKFSPSSYIVALTADSAIGSKEKYLSNGFDDYIAKPISKLELERVLKTDNDTLDELEII